MFELHLGNRCYARNIIQKLPPGIHLVRQVMKGLSSSFASPVCRSAWNRRTVVGSRIPGRALRGHAMDLASEVAASDISLHSALWLGKS